MIRALVVDDVADLRHMTRLALESTGRVEVVGEAGDGEAAIVAAGELQPDLVLLDLAMPVLDGLTALPRIRRAAPSASVVVVSGMEQDAVAAAVAAGGAVGFVSKDLSPKRLAAEVLALGGVVAAVRTHLERDLASPRTARHFVEDALTQWECDQQVDVINLLVSELVTNAVVHAGSAADVAVRLTDTTVRVSVADTGAGMPNRKDVGAEETSGRGVGLVDTLAAAWGIERLPVGKAIWFEVPRT